MSPSVMLHLFPDDTRCHGPPTKPEIIHPRQFDLGSLIHLFIVAILFSSPTLGYVCISTTYFYSQFLYPGSHTSAAQTGFPLHCQLVFFSLVQPPSPQHLPPSTNQCRGRILAISLIQRYLRTARWLSALQGPPCPSIASATHCVRLQMAAFHLQFVPMV